MKIKIILVIILIIFIRKPLFSQNLGSTLLRNYTSETYNSHVQNWSVVKDKRGVMYFANYSAVLEYDGTNWRKIETENNYAIRSLDIDDYGTVYVGCEGAFGYLAPDSLGNMQYNSISAKYDSTIIKTLPIIWRVRVVNNEVYFNALKVLYKYSPYKKDTKTDNDKLKSWYAETGFYIGFSVFNKFFIIDRSKGLMEMKDETLVLVKNGEKFIKTPLFAMVPNTLNSNANEIIITTSEKLYKYNPNADTTNNRLAITEFKTQLDSVYEKKDYYMTETLPENKFALGTVSNGVIVIDSAGNICEIISKQNGLQDNTVWYLKYYDHCLWMTLNNGIAKSEIVSPFRIWNDYNSLEGSVTSITEYNNKLFVTTNSLGVWYLNKEKFNGTIPTFTKLETISEAWELINYKVNKTNVLLLGLHNNLLEVDKNTTVKNILKSSIYSFEISEIDSNIVYAGGKSLYVLKRNHQTNTWLNNFLYKFESPIVSIVEDNNTLWLTTKLNGVYKIKVNSLEDYFLSTEAEPKFEITNYNENAVGLEDIDNLNVYKFDSKIIFSNTNKILRYNESNNSFEPYDYFGNKIKNVTYTSVFLHRNNFGDFWIGNFAILYKQKDGSYIADTMLFKRFPIKSINSFYADSNQVWYLGNSDGLVEYNKKYDYDYNANFNVLIRKVNIKNDSVIFYGTFYEKNEISGVNVATLVQNKKLIPKIEYKFNSLYFSFAAPFFIEELETEYSYLLENFDKTWSEWNDKTEKEYTNLPAGKYTFKVKARNVFEKESEIATYQFQILAPWYQTWVAYLLYFIIFVLFIYFVIKIYTRRLKSQNIKLEKTVDDRTKEIKMKNVELEQQKEEIQAQADNLIEINNQLYQQKEEIESQAEQLEIYNVELEKLSIVASQTDNAIMILDELGNFEWINDAYTRMYGFTFNELIKYFGENIKGNKSEEWLINLINDCIDNKKTVEYEQNIITKNNENIWIHTTLTPILNDTGEIYKLVAIDSDIRKLKYAEREIQKQKDILQLQNQQITASIRYAKTIQTAILPMETQIAENFEHFIIFRPKDIVSGDFYMFISNVIDKHEYFFAATVDCTGHGVPGAFMSMIASRIINEIIKEKNIFETNKILDELDTNIRKALKQEFSQNNDGMDLCICRIEKFDNCKAVIIFTGAKRPLYYYKNGAEEVSILKADRKSIGGRKQNIDVVFFTNQTIILDKTDIIYLSTDGLIDQNNEDRKRFGSSNFLRTLNNNKNQALDIQKNMLEKALNDWQQNCEQRDDITVFALKI